ncbi:MAG TPA: CHAD domain-containing protein [Stellaceae bacterium]|nr:CHAD domain-containing protein [Stellaceae bacterium]
MDAAVRKPGALQLTPDLTVGDGLQEMLAGALGALQGQGSSAKAPSRDSVHRLRVGVRRLRSILSAFSDALPDGERRALGDRLRAVAQRFGRGREWDVFLAHLVTDMRKALPEEEEVLAEVERLAGEARRAALPPGDSIKTSLAAIETAMDEASWLRRPTSSLAGCWETPLPEYAAPLLSRRHRQLRKRVKRIELADQHAFHNLRVRVKKLRYPAELLKSLFDEEAAADYLDRLVHMQDALGALNDALAARRLVGELALPVLTQRLLLGWITRDIETCRERFPARGRAFRHGEPFWDG